MIIQINIWCCEVCGRQEFALKESDSCGDPVATPSSIRRWGRVKADDREFLACPACLVEEGEEEERAISRVDIIQINIWCCGVCGRKVIVSDEISPYSDPTAVPPGGVNWGYVVVDGEQFFACPSCLAL